MIKTIDDYCYSTLSPQGGTNILTLISVLQEHSRFKLSPFKTAPVEC